MGNFFVARVVLTATAGTAANIALWALTAGTGRNIRVWRHDLVVGNVGAAGAAGSLSAIFRREAAGAITAGAAGTISPIVPGQTPVSTVIFDGAGLTGVPAGDLFNAIAHTASIIGVTPYTHDASRYPGASDIGVADLRAGQQWALCTLEAVPAGGTYKIFGTVLFEEL